MPHFACPGYRSVLTRRDAIKAGGLGLLGFAMPELLRAEALPRKLKVRAKSVIFLFQWGGPSHLDMFDMKPNAPEGVRGPSQPIASSADGIQVSERLPLTANVMNKVTLVRSVHHTMNNHNSAGYYALTGHAPATDDQRLRDSLPSKERVACTVRNANWLLKYWGCTSDNPLPPDPVQPEYGFCRLANGATEYADLCATGAR